MDSNNVENNPVKDDNMQANLDSFKIELDKLMAIIKEVKDQKNGKDSLSDLNISSPFDVDGIIKAIEFKMGKTNLSDSKEFKEKAKALVEQALEKTYGQEIDFNEDENPKDNSPIKKEGEIENIDSKKGEKAQEEGQSPSVSKKEVKDFSAMVREQAVSILSSKGRNNNMGLAERILVGDNELERYNPANRYLREMVFKRMNLERLMPDKRAAKAMQDTFASKGINAINRSTAIDMFEDSLEITSDEAREEYEKLSEDKQKIKEICEQEENRANYGKETNVFNRFMMGFAISGLDKKNESGAIQHVRLLARKGIEDRESSEDGLNEETLDDEVRRKIEEGLDKHDALSEANSIAKNALERAIIEPDEKSIAEFCSRLSNAEDVSRMVDFANKGKDKDQDDFGEIAPPVVTE
jgi:hypothetical protein